MDNDVKEVYHLINRELVSVWGYLVTYVELFEHEDRRRRELLNCTAPGFFGLVQSALIECCLIRLARLMDSESGRGGKDKNLSFERLFKAGWHDVNPADAKEKFEKIKKEWNENGGKYKVLNNHRDKVLAHNDLPTISSSPVSVSTKLTHNEVCLLRGLFLELWAVLVKTHELLPNGQLVEPQFDSLENHPVTIFRHLKSSIFLDEIADEAIDNDSLDFFRRWSKFKYSSVGSDGLLRLIDGAK
jgi:hypothetical protein